jgi:hypothetical protein
MYAVGRSTPIAPHSSCICRMGVRTSVLLIGYTVRWLFHQASLMVLAEALHKHRAGA